MNCKRDTGFTLKSLEDNGTFSGYASVFGVVDSYGDVVMPGAFASSLKEHAAAGTMPLMLWQHNHDMPIGKYSLISEDEKGLYVEGELFLELAQARDAYVLLKRGGISGMSIGYKPVKAARTAGGQRQLVEIKLFEISLVSFPANQQARIEEVKAAESIKSIREFETWLRDEGGFSVDRARQIAAAGWNPEKQMSRDETELAGKIGELSALFRS